MRFAWCLLATAVLTAACGQGVEPGAKGGPVPSPSPSVVASPTPISVPLAVSNSTPVIFFRDAANFEQVDGVTWDGVVGSSPGTPDYHASNPSETLFGATTEIRDRRGTVVNRGSFGFKSFTATWADDDVHYCLIQPFDYLGADGIPATLVVGSSEGGASPVLQVGKIYEQSNTFVASCSFAGDRAVVVQSGGQGVGVAQYWVVRISTRQVLWTHNFATGNAPMVLVASHDSRFIAENSVTPSGDETSVIYSGDGSRLAQLNASVAAFSWDGSTMVLSSSRAPQPAWVARLNDGRVSWAAPTETTAYVWRAVAQPNGGGLAIGLADRNPPASAQTTGYPPVDLYVVAADGAVVATLRKVYW